MSNKKYISTFSVTVLSILFFTFLCISITYRDKYKVINKAYQSCLDYQEKREQKEKVKLQECKNLVVYRYTGDNVVDVYKLQNIVQYSLKDKILSVKGTSTKLTLQGTFTVIECKKNSKAWSRAVEYHKGTDGHNYAYYYNKKHNTEIPEEDITFSDL